MSKLIIALYVITTSMALVVLKLGTKAGAPVEFANGNMSFNINSHTITGVFLYGVSFILYTYLLSKFDLGYIIPVVTAFVYVLIFIASFFIFKETFTILKTVGIVFILIGLLLLNSTKN